jgi:hypothetical protein
LDSESKLLPGDSPLINPPQQHTEINLDSDTLESYAGKYQFIPNMFMIITRKDNQLLAQLTGQGAIEIYPESKTDFFYKAVDAQILFKADSQGKANALVLRQLGREQLAKRVEGNAENTQEWFGHRESKVDPSIFDRYVGKYQMPAEAVFTVTREGDHLYTQLTGQPKLEIFAESERVFFAKAVDGQITFETEGTEPAKALILHQNGRDIRAPRIAAK